MLNGGVGVAALQMPNLHFTFEDLSWERSTTTQDQTIHKNILPSGLATPSSPTQKPHSAPPEQPTSTGTIFSRESPVGREDAKEIPHSVDRPGQQSELHSFPKWMNSDPERRALSAVFSGVRHPRSGDRPYRTSGGRSCINIEGPFYDEDYDRWDYYDTSRPSGPRRLDYCRHGEVEVVCLHCNGSYGHGGDGRARSRDRDRDRRRRRRGGVYRTRDGAEIIACYTGDFEFPYDGGARGVDGYPGERGRRPRRRRRRSGHGWSPDRQYGFEPMYDFGPSASDFDFDFEHESGLVYDYDFDRDFDAGYDFSFDCDYGDGTGRRERRRRGSRRDRAAADDLWREMDRMERRADEAERWLWREYGG
ncbi:uncharacterized protein Z520_11775 [Fonsecaea multimorphosa CBS 102226]|uniref:Uncharacterized protein n=1 Tax=Fonsecaea multimorphosa CBS 102226 TaxID=1442371 RepID=A0A0D2GSN0_9EURO|nr:uncharacterized protein Z520_11775 [Fonsecaea multimorphosa CBS 102226]KIX92455.1 hypothetical protein Z520_11775 [Fonsecaea multimorphosa CBS 102226]